MTSGFFIIDRKLLEHPIWLSEQFSFGQAWADLIGLTNYEDGYIIVAGEKIDINRGQCGWSEVRLAGRWKWSRGRVRRFLVFLEKEKQITKKRNTRTTIITICNYYEYQDQYKKTEHQTDIRRTSDGHQTDIRRYTIKENNNNNNNNEYSRDDAAYFFDGEVIKVTEKDFHQLQKYFPDIPNIASELFTIDPKLKEKGYFNHDKKWFMTMKGWLNKANQRYAQTKNDKATLNGTVMTDAELRNYMLHH